MKYCSQFVLSHSKYSRILGSSLSFNRFSIFRWNMHKHSFLFAIDVGPRLSLVSLLCILVFLSTACLACFPSFHVDSPNCCICLVVQQMHRERCQSARCGRDVVQTHRSNQWLFGIVCVPNRFPIDPKYS